MHIPRRQDQNSQELHRAATIIQTTYRKHAARSVHQKRVQAVVTLQKYIRGWLVRYHLPDHMAECYDQICQETYHRAALVIQATWRGFQV